MKMWGITNTGLVRSENQDAYAVFEADAFHAAVVCDGQRHRRSPVRKGAARQPAGRYGHPAAAAGNAQRYRLRQ